jgi:hypothetical protein
VERGGVTRGLECSLPLARTRRSEWLEGGDRELNSLGGIHVATCYE